MFSTFQESWKNTLIRVSISVMLSAYAITCFALFLKEDGKIMDAFLAVLLTGTVALAIGNTLKKAGLKNSIAFGEVAGQYISTLGIITPCLAYLLALYAYAFWQMPLALDTAPRWSIVVLLATLLLAALSIIEKLHRSERSHMENERNLEKNLSRANRRASENESYALAWKKLRDELDENDIRGTDIIHRFNVKLAESRSELRAKRTKGARHEKKRAF